MYNRVNKFQLTIKKIKEIDMEENFIYRRLVQYYETDQMGVVHHSNYIRWFEESRVDMMNKMEYTYKMAEESGLMIPVIGVTCRYKSPAKFGNIIKIIPSLNVLRPVKMTIGYKIFNDDSGILLAEGETDHCFVDSDFKPVSLKLHSPKLHEIFSKYLSKNNKNQGGI